MINYNSDSFTKDQLAHIEDSLCVWHTLKSEMISIGHEYESISFQSWQKKSGDAFARLYANQTERTAYITNIIKQN